METCCFMNLILSKKKKEAENQNIVFAHLHQDFG